MKKPFAALVMVFAVGVMACGCGGETPAGAPPPAVPAAAPATQEALAKEERVEIAADNANSSFETDNAGVLSGWQFSEGVKGWLRKNTEARTGAHALRLEGVNTPGEARFWSDPLPVQTGDMVEFQGWVKSEGTVQKGPVLWVEIQPEGGAWTVLEPKAEGPLLRVRDFPKHWTWQPRGGCLIIPRGAVRARVVGGCSLENPPGSAWLIDDVAMRIASIKRYRKEQAKPAPAENCMLVVVDTLAANRLPSYGFAKGHTPNICNLARDGVLFEDTATACPWTRPSFASIFTSRYPSQHTAELANSRLPESETTLAQVLKEHGYFTAGFVRTPYDGYIGPGNGFGHGFDLYYYSGDEDSLFAAVKAFLDLNQAEISAAGGGLFLMVHFIEPHAPYINHFPETIRNGGTLGNQLDNDIIGGILDRGEDPDIAYPKDMEYARACYDSEVTFTDERLGELLFRMKQTGLYDRLNVVFAADHGEAFGERPKVWDHAIPHSSATQVPLIMRFPGRTQPGHRIPEPASTLDIMPTLLAALNIPAPRGCEGINLLDPGARPPLRYLISESKSRGVYEQGSLAIQDGRYKLDVWNAALRAKPDDWTSSRWVLYDENSPSRWELFDIKTDPNELHDIGAEQPDVLNRMKEALRAHCDRTGISGNKSAPPKDTGMSDEAQADLKAMGYIK
jgi:arylsulfatase A-like enzyme